MADNKDLKKFRGGIRLESTTAPDNAEAGALYFDSEAGGLKVHTGEEFTDVGGSGGGGVDIFWSEDFSGGNIEIWDDGGMDGSFDTTLSSRTLKFTYGTSENAEVRTNGPYGIYQSEVLVPTARQKGKTCTFSFWYKTSGSFAEGDIKLWLREDASDSTDILLETLPAAPNIKKYVTTFTMPSDATQLEWGMYNTREVTTADPIYIHIDDMEMSQDPFVKADLGTITEWETFTPVGNKTTNVTYTGKKRRVGDTMEYQVRMTVSGTTDSGDVEIGTSAGNFLGDGLIDESKMATLEQFHMPLGDFVWETGDANHIHGHVVYSAASAVKLRLFFETNAYESGGYRFIRGSEVTSGNPTTLGSGVEIHINFKVPIVGLGSTNTHIVTPSESVQPAMRQMAAAGALPNATTEFLCFTTEITDSDDLFSGTATGFQSALADATYYTCPMDGVYQVDMGIKLASEDIDGDLPAYAVYLRRYNSSDVQQEEICLIEKIDLGVSAANVTVVETAVRSINCSKGDKLTLRLFNNCGATCERITDDQNWFHVTKIHHKPQLSAIPYTKYQKKILTGSNVSSDGDVSGISFTSLDSSKIYRATCNARFEDTSNSDNEGLLKFYSGSSASGTLYATTGYVSYPATATGVQFYTHTSFIFTGTTTLYAYLHNISGGDLMVNDTFVFLEELPMHTETDIW